METYSVVSIVCPQCGTELSASVDVCHQCGAKTASETDKAHGEPQSHLMDRPWLLILVLLHLGLLGIPLYWKTSYSTPVRLAIIAASIAYTLFVVIFVVLVIGAVVNAVRG